jgi:hypothetical protein
VRRALRCLSFAIIAAGLAACHDNLSAAASADANTCYRLPAGTTARKVALSSDDENLETCAMHLEGYRLQHGQPAATGLYEDHYVYASTGGITAAATQTGIRYHVYTRAQQADLDGKLHILITQADAAGNTTAPANTTGATAGAQAGD